MKKNKRRQVTIGIKEGKLPFRTNKEQKKNVKSLSTRHPHLTCGKKIQEGKLLLESKKVSYS